MNHPGPPLPRVRPTWTFAVAHYPFRIIAPEYDNTTFDPNQCSRIQMGTTTASTIFVKPGFFLENLFEADLSSLRLSGFAIAHAVNPPNTPATTLTA